MDILELLGLRPKQPLLSPDTTRDIEEGAMQEGGYSPANAPPPGPHGLFGIKGTGRDILGTLGDAFLVQSGNKAVYGPQRDQEQEGELMSNFTQDPLGTINRLASRNPEAARQLYEKYQQSQVANAGVQQRAEAAKATAVDRQQDNDVKTASIIGAMMHAANENTWPAIRDQVMKFAAKRGYELPMELPEKFDPLFKDQNQYFGATQGEAMTDLYRGERLPQMAQDLELRRIESVNRDLDRRQDNARQDQGMQNQTTNTQQNVRRTDVAVDPNNPLNIRKVTPPASKRTFGGAGPSAAPAPPGTKIGSLKVNPVTGKATAKWNGKTWEPIK